MGKMIPLIKPEKNELEDILDIFLCTYNRKMLLEKTLKSLLSPESPIRKLPITILDNASTDGTSELIEEYCLRFPNIRHIRNNRNISGNANIAKAFEMAKKQYFWVLCDDDSYDWSSWDEIEQVLLSKEYDCILTERKIDFTNQDLPYIINSLAFVPCGIYKTSNITDTVMSNIESNIMYSFPHLALGCSLLNHHKQFYIPERSIIIQNVNMEFTKGIRDEIHFRQAHVNLFSGYINSYQMIKDKKLRKKCCDVLWVGKSFYYSMKEFFRTNGLFPYNISDVFWGISFSQKIWFVLAFLRICILSKIIHALMPKSIGQFIFSLHNSKDKKHKIIQFMGFKLKIKRKSKRKK